jgi:putative restriction endonuclease
MLWALGKLKNSAVDTYVYAEVEQEISQLIDEFSPVSNNRYRAEMPFFHMEKELWELTGNDEIGPKRSILRRNNATANLKPEIVSLLKSEPGLIEEAARFLVETHFTESYVEPIFSAVGLDAGVIQFSTFAVSVDQKKEIQNSETPY